MNFLDELKSLNIPYDTRTSNSDLYVLVSEVTKQLILKHKLFATTFTCRISGKLYYDVFGGNSDYWQEKQFDKFRKQ